MAFWRSFFKLNTQIILKNKRVHIYLSSTIYRPGVGLCRKKFLLNKCINIKMLDSAQNKSPIKKMTEYHSLLCLSRIFDQTNQNIQIVTKKYSHKTIYPCAYLA